MRITPYQPSKTYIIKSNGVYKIGRSKNIAQRIKGMGTDNPCEVELIKTFPNDIENYLHKLFGEHRLRNEWFNLPDNWESMINESDARLSSSEYVDLKKLSALRVTDTNYIELRKKCLTSWKWKIVSYGFDMLADSVYWEEVVVNFPYGIKIVLGDDIDEVPHEIQLVVTVTGNKNNAELVIDNPMETDEDGFDLY